MREIVVEGEVAGEEGLVLLVLGQIQRLGQSNIVFEENR